MKELRDQTAHAAAAFLILLPPVLYPHWATLALAGFCIGMVREITEEGTPVTLSKIRKALDSKLDLTFWTLGGALVSLVL